MLSLLLVPLDGSPFAEQALAPAVTIARRHGAALHLVAVHRALVQPLDYQGAPVYDTRFDDDRRRELADYLAATTGRLRDAGLTATCAVLEHGQVAEAVAEEAGRRGADLVAMTTHGRGGLSRAWLGSVASALLQAVPVPLLVIRAAEAAPAAAAGGPSDAPAPPPRHVLVPLDGSPLAETALAPAVALVRPFDARLTVLRVVRTAETRLPYDQTFWTPTEQEYLDEQQAVARTYVDRIVGQLREGGATAEGMVTLEPDAARAVLRVAGEQAVDLVAISTHARSGVSRLVLGSVTDKVIRGADCPVLVVRPGE